MASGLLLIRGLGHSGTTILDLSLGVHPEIMGLGEAMRLLRQPRPEEISCGPAYLRGHGRFKRRCTCEALAVNCPLWGPMLDWLSTHDDLPLEKKLDRLLALAERSKSMPGQSSPRWIVESYQADTISPDWLAEQLGRPVRVIFLVRDARSWIHSRIRRVRNPLTGCQALMRWWWLNRKMERKLNASCCPVFQMGYEELALEPEKTLERLCNWLNLTFDKAMLHPGGNSSSHILSGNRIRFDIDHCANIRYDASWLTCQSPAVSFALGIPAIASMNQRLVYSSKIITRS